MTDRFFVRIATAVAGLVLSFGALAAAGLDVFESEPAIRAAFLTLPNVVLAPHQGSATVETRLAMGEAVLANLAAHFAGARPPGPPSEPVNAPSQ